jgi:leucyl aminopeptidase (aminopeptidase T)
MSWSLAIKAKREEARKGFAQAHAEQPEYATSKDVMDKVAVIAAELAEATPEGSMVELATSGDLQGESGSFSVSLNFHPPVQD